MWKRCLGILCLVTIISVRAQSQELKSHQIYDQQKQPVTFSEMAEALKGYDVILFGEFHNNPLIHWIQLRLTQELYQQSEDLVLGAEMLEADNQLILDEYFEGLIDNKRFEAEMRLWPNYSTDYKPLVEFARNNNLKFVATNIPRRYASLVSKQGLESLDSLSELAQTYIAPLPIEVDTLTPGYGEMFDMMKRHSSQGMEPINFIAAQAVKDATMAHFINGNLPAEGVFIHFNGDYHSKQFGGIYWYLTRLNPSLEIAVIAVFEDPEETLDFPENEEHPATFSIVVPSSFTKTH